MAYIPSSIPQWYETNILWILSSREEAELVLPELHGVLLNGFVNLRKWKLNVLNLFLFVLTNEHNINRRDSCMLNEQLDDPSKNRKYQKFLLHLQTVANNCYLFTKEPE